MQLDWMTVEQLDTILVAYCDKMFFDGRDYYTVKISGDPDPPVDFYKALMQDAAHSAQAVAQGNVGMLRARAGHPAYRKSPKEDIPLALQNAISTA